MSSSTNSGFKKLILIDGNAVLHRAYHALPPLTTKSGEPINAVYGLVSMLLKVVRDLEPTHIAVAFDRKEPTFRKVEFANYQSHRPETHEDLSSQFAKARDTLEAFGIQVYEKAGFEADDVIGTLATIACEMSKIDEVIIITGDRDILQLVNDKKKIRVYMPVSGLSKMKMYEEKDVIERMGVFANKIIDFKALVGDQSDNYPGVAGIGPKTAIALLDEYGDLDSIYKNINEIKEAVKKKLEAGRDSAYLSRHLATIVKDVELEIDFEKLRAWEIGSQKSVDLFTNTYGFETLTRRVTEDRMTRSGLSRGINPATTAKKNLSRKDVEGVVVKIAKKIKGGQYAIRGTASLLLQDIDMVVDDIDIVANKKTALLFNKVLKEYLVEKVEWQESDKFKSYLGKFIVDGVAVEIMGEWSIKTPKGNWSEVFDASSDEVVEMEINGQKVKITKTETELKMFSDMGRWNAYHKLKREVDRKSQQSLF